MAPLLYAESGDPALRHAALRAAALEPLRLADLRALLEALAGRGVDVLITKGTALAYSLYASPDLRPRADTDLLIDAVQLDAARKVFRELGYAESINSGDMHQTMFRRVDAAGADHVYDLHWALANTPVFAGVLTFDELRGRSVALPGIGEQARTLSDVDALLYACVHRVAHHFDSDRLIWLADIHFLRERMSDDEHARFWALAAEREVVGVCMRSIERSREEFGGSERGLAQQFLDAA
ncbi:MAG TPA: nucleotidyltransferase family protein, partial [Thermoanaerobaculia bacterium]|nr:nucleotidyltransferase family protein [Thermoanaerobaculia bacterium]